MKGAKVEYEELVAASEPDALRASLAANAADLQTASHAHHGDELASVRTTHHAGHEIVIKTTYEITIDGQPFVAHVNVDNNGHVHYHGLPTRDFASTVDLVEKVIDSFPDDFREPTPPSGRDEDTNNHGSSHDHGAGD
jgi:hypothetical protein